MNAPTDSPAASGLARFVPILGWLPRYRREWLRPDVIAGLTVAALVVPKALGDIFEMLRGRGIEPRLARVKPAVMEVLRRDGVADRIGAANFHGNVFEASKDLIAGDA